MNLKFIKNFSYYTIGNVLPKIFSFFLLPIYTKYLAPSDYGIVNSMDVLSGVLVILFTLSIERSMYRLYYDYKTEKGKRDFLGTMVIAIFLVSTFILILLFIFHQYVENIYKAISFYPYFAFSIISAYFSTFALIPKIYFQVREKANIFLILSLLQFISNVSCVLFFVVYLKQNALGMIKGGFLGSCITLPIYLIISFRIINFRFDLKIFRESLKFSLPMFPVVISGWVLNLSDRIFIERFFSPTEVGIYSLSYKLAGMVMIFVSSLELAFNPVFYRLANSEDQIIAKQKISKLINYYTLTLMLICFSIAFFSREIIYFFIDNRFQEAYKIVPLISLSYFIYVTGGIYNTMIYQKKKTSLVMYATVFSAISSITLNFILIPRLGIYGASISAILAYSIALSIKNFYARRCYYIKINPQIIIWIIAAIIVVASSFVIGSLNPWHLLFIKIIFTSIIILIVFKKNYSKILNLIKNNN
jgi:O-antigen/teichoic acid export membrane protein